MKYDIIEILTRFLSGRVRPIFGKYEFRRAAFEPGPKILIKRLYLLFTSKHDLFCWQKYEFFSLIVKLNAHEMLLKF